MTKIQVQDNFWKSKIEEDLKSKLYFRPKRQGQAGILPNQRTREPGQGPKIQV